MYYSERINTLPINSFNNKFNRCCYIDTDQENTLFSQTCRSDETCESMDEILLPWKSMTDLPRVPVLRFLNKLSAQIPVCILFFFFFNSKYHRTSELKCNLFFSFVSGGDM